MLLTAVLDLVVLGILRFACFLLLIPVEVLRLVHVMLRVLVLVLVRVKFLFLRDLCYCTDLYHHLLIHVLLRGLYVSFSILLIFLSRSDNEMLFPLAVLVAVSCNSACIFSAMFLCIRVLHACTCACKKWVHVCFVWFTRKTCIFRNLLQIVLELLGKTVLTAGMEMQLDGDERELIISLRPLPKVTKLLQNYPNPFNPETWIPYQLNQASEVSLKIYSNSGRY